mgnify:CR=1 FL=1
MAESNPPTLSDLDLDALSIEFKYMEAFALHETICTLIAALREARAEIERLSEVPPRGNYPNKGGHASKTDGETPESESEPRQLIARAFCKSAAPGGWPYPSDLEWADIALKAINFKAIMGELATLRAENNKLKNALGEALLAPDQSDKIEICNLESSLATANKRIEEGKADIQRLVTRGMRQDERIQELERVIEAVREFASGVHSWVGTHLVSLLPPSPAQTESK